MENMPEVPDEEPRKSLQEWEETLNNVAAEETDEQIHLPANVRGKRVNREALALAFVSAFEVVGGVPRLAKWMDENYSEGVKVMGRLLPKEVLTTHDGEVTVNHALPRTPLDV